MLVKNQDHEGWSALLRFAGFICIINMKMFCITDSSMCVCWVFVMMTVWNVHCVVSADTRLVSNRSEMTINPHTKPQRFRYTNSHASLLLQIRCHELYCNHSSLHCYWLEPKGDLWTIERPLTCVSNRKWNNSPSRRTLRDVSLSKATHRCHVEKSLDETPTGSGFTAEQSWRLNCGCHGDKTLTDTSITETH